MLNSLQSCNKIILIYISLHFSYKISNKLYNEKLLNVLKTLKRKNNNISTYLVSFICIFYIMFKSKTFAFLYYTYIKNIRKCTLYPIKEIFSISLLINFIKNNIHYNFFFFSSKIAECIDY